MNLNDIKSIAIMRTSALGDMIWTLPLLNSLKKNCPMAKITYISSNPFSQLLEGDDNIEIINIKKPKSISDYLNIRSQFKGREFDILLCTQASLRINFIYPLIKARTKVGFNKENARDLQTIFTDKQIEYHNEHSVISMKRFGEVIGLTDTELDFTLPYIEHNLNLPEKFICLHPQASNSQKTWSTKSYIELCNMASKELDLPIVLSGGPTDKKLCNEIEKDSHASIINLCAKTTISELKTILKTAYVVISPDSGPAHIAAALGTKVLGLYAAYNPKLTGPYGQYENCIDAYQRALQIEVGSKKVPYNYRIKDENVMDLISVEEVLNKLRSLI